MRSLSLISLPAGLDDDFDPMVSAVVAPVEAISPADLYMQMLAHELRREWQPSYANHGSYSSANATMCGHGGPGRFNGLGHGHSHGGRSLGNNNNSSAPAPRLSSMRSHSKHLPFLMQIGWAVQVIENLLESLLSVLDLTSFHGLQRSILQYHGLARRQNIRLWIMLLLNLCGSKLCSRN
jgi:hypothetical protein